MYHFKKKNRKYTLQEAYTEAQNVVKERLKAPNTAQFSSPYLAKLDDTTFMCSGDVDAQNGFGGYGRMYWSVTITFMPGGLVYRHHVLLEDRDEE